MLFFRLTMLNVLLFLIKNRDMKIMYSYPVVFTGKEQVKLNSLKGYTKIGYKSEIIAKHILEQNSAISSCSFVTGKDNIHLGDIKLKMRGYTRKDQARYVEVKTGTLYNGRKKLCIDYKYTLKNCPDIEYKQSSTGAWIHAQYDTLIVVFSNEIYMINEGYSLLEKVQRDVELKRLQTPNLDDDWYNIRNVEIANGLVATTNQVHAKYDTWLLSLDLDTYLDFNNINYKRIAYELVQPKRVE